jgi:hypothetical protein
VRGRKGRTTLLSGPRWKLIPWARLMSDRCWMVGRRWIWPAVPHSKNTATSL